MPPQVFAAVPGHGATGVQVHDSPIYTGTYHPTIWAQFTEPISVSTATTGTMFVTDDRGHRMSGQVDYLLRIVVPDIQRYDEVYKKLISKIELSDVSSSFAMEQIKFTTALPLDYALERN